MGEENKTFAYEFKYELMFHLIYHLPHPTHYHQYFITKVHESGLTDIEVVYYDSLLTQYPWNSALDVRAKTITLKKGLLGIDFNYLFKKKKKGFHFVAGWVEPTMIILLTIWAIKGVPYIVGTDTVFPRTKKGIKEIMRSAWLYYFILRRARAVVTTGKRGQELIQKLPIGTTPVYNYPFVTDLDIFSAKKRSEPNPEFVIFSSGRLDIKHKGYDTAIGALGLLKKHSPDFQFVYKIAGTGPDKEEIMHLIKAHNLKNEVELLGWKESVELPALYNSADIFLHPSNFDPYPNAVLEAMACGKIVIASDAAGSAVDRIDNNKNGFLHKAGSIEELSSILIRVTGFTQEEREAIENAARKTAEKWTYKYNLSVLSHIMNQ